MKYETILKMPDSKEKFIKLENKLLKLQHHGYWFYVAKDEYFRLFQIYRGKMSAQNRETLKATIYNLSCGDAALYAALASMTDEQIEQVLTEICSRL